MVQLSHPYMTTGKTIALSRQTFVGKVMSVLFNMLSSLVIAFSSKEQASFNFMAAVTICSDFGAQENKVSHCFHCFPSICHDVMRPDAVILVFWRLSFKTGFLLSSFAFIKRLFSFSYFLPYVWCLLHIWGYWYFSRHSWFQLVLHPAQHFSWCTLHIVPCMMYSVIINLIINGINGWLDEWINKQGTVPAHKELMVWEGDRCNRTVIEDKIQGPWEAYD